MRIRYVLGNACSFVGLVVLFSACTQPKWAFDTVNSVDIGLWFLTGTGVQYKLINAGIPPEDVAAPSNKQPFTLYRRFCSYDIVRAKDPWCHSKAMIGRALTVIALMSAIVGFTFSLMAALNVKTPTWNGEGKETTLVNPILCAFVQVGCLIPTVVVWSQMVKAYDAQCRAAMKIEDFTCISTAKAFTMAIADIVLAAITFVLWRISHAYEVARRAGRIADGFTLAAKTDNVDEILSGIANKIDVDALGSDGRNALHWACTLNRSSICHVLLKKGANLSKKDREGWTPLHWASRVGNLDIVRLLAKYGADLNVQDRWGTTPLMLTVVGESRAAAETLIELGADLNARNAQGWTALHYAAANGNASLFYNILQLCDADLVEKRNKVRRSSMRGIILHVTDRASEQHGETLLDVAQIRGHSHIEALLQDWRDGKPIVVERDGDDDAQSEIDTSDTSDSDGDGDGSSSD
ncbi:hypothetical protein P43SY_007493 [Pythium insidiosum]|uniref:Uncharacterized protein n=1 Tax=Pythium insidiosum TaxID=114742 RepID=A0AAD5LCT8_PYTIN|nr:hypothetical protein P43SY_007493 [Pythium insidiosum]